jgi:hypothetical protein
VVNELLDGLTGRAIALYIVAATETNMVNHGKPFASAGA